LTTFPNKEKRVENAMRSRAFLVNFEVFGNVFKPCLSVMFDIREVSIKTKTNEKKYL